MSKAIRVSKPRVLFIALSAPFCYDAFSKPDNAILMKNFSRFSLLSLITAQLISMTALSGCEKPLAAHQYTEIIVEPPTPSNSSRNDSHDVFSQMPQDKIHAPFMGGDSIPVDMQTTDPVLQEQLNASVARLPLIWQTPAGWAETKGSGMRLATFHNTDKKNPVEATIISLGGSAGGMNANVSRWMQQINLEVPAAQELDEFIKQQERLKTAADLPYILIDFTRLQDKKNSDVPSMMAAVVEVEGAQIFVKMTGTQQAVLQNRKTFMDLVRSLQINE